MLGQKQAVINKVLEVYPTFNLGSDNAITVLSEAQIEQVKSDIQRGIIDGTIDYSKDRTNVSEVRSYARSMVMNHFKKAKELNGGGGYTPSPKVTSTLPKTPKVSKPKDGIDRSLLPQDLVSFIDSL